MRRLGVFAALVFFSSHSYSQEFVKTSGSRFTFNGEPFYFFGFNAYYLQSEAAKGNRYIVDETLEAAKELNVPVIRTWAFYEGSENDTSAIRFSPDGYNEMGLQALDYAVYKAKENGIKLILTLANNSDDFGGIAEYIKWAGAYLRGSYSHNDFFKNDSIKTWYKDYISKILTRENIYTGVAYKDEPAIFSFELINEASSGGAYERASIKEWYEEMSAYFKQIDANHLLTTGEIGYDERTEYYHNPDLFYNSGYFLLNGYKGTSYYENSSLKNIDYASYHLYPDGWRMNPAAGAMWIEDHQRIAESFGKAALLGEFGLKNNREYYK
ncbi:MAG TPA: cellulase family glycosylhydrolase, partial [Ignavibacteriales bacterium]|nr:cellulase family glycosylhydrolase [Ignavibacteriales bacterium]